MPITRWIEVPLYKTWLLVRFPDNEPITEVIGMVDMSVDRSRAGDYEYRLIRNSLPMAAWASSGICDTLGLAKAIVEAIPRPWEEKEVCEDD